MKGKRKSDNAEMPTLWLEVEEDILRKWYEANGSDFCNTVIEELLGWNRGNRNVMQKAWKLGLRYAGPKRGVFKKGHATFNKGKKMPAEIYARAAPTMFKPGQLPKNTRDADGAISIRYDNRGAPVKHIRVSLGKWEYLSRHVWRQHNGEIPKGHIVTHKDGDPMNCEPGNLALMSRADNARRNSNREKFRAWHQELTDEYVLHWQRRYRGAEGIDLETARANGLIEIWRTEIQLKRKLTSVNKKNQQQCTTPRKRH